MAIIKKYTLNNLTTSIFTGRYKAGLIFEPQNNTIWLNSEPHDHDSLGQIYEKTCPVFNLLGEEHLTRSFFKYAILSKNSTALCNQNWSANYFQNININHLERNLSRDLCLDNSLVINNQGSLLEFTSSSNTKFYLYNYQSGQTSDHYPRDTDFLMIEGDNFSTAAVAYINLATGGSSGTNTQSGKFRGNYSPLYVDTTNKKIYWSMKLQATQAIHINNMDKLVQLAIQHIQQTKMTALFQFLQLQML